ncbi:hypothetical protein [Rhodococcus sp. 06-1474-1B]|uniref:hypothetical protein n=1 Tax=Rhodococcus sp. 06-1474-1B TaxID=2022499 RepID=UPI00113FCAAB|nr:hypothetical protein [Rhodococcus sp. 06-1474-1B]
MPDDDEYGSAFRPYAEPQTFEGGVQFTGTNVCRIAALSALFDFQSRTDIAQYYRDPLEEVGISSAMVDRSASFPSQTATFPLARSGTMPGSPADKSESWTDFLEQPSTASACRFLFSMLGSSNSRESITAAVALWKIAEADFPEEIDSQRFHIWQRLYRSRGNLWLSELFAEGKAIDNDPSDDAANSLWRAGSIPGGQSYRWAEKYSRLSAGGNKTNSTVSQESIVSVVSSRLSEGLRSGDNYVAGMAGRIFALPPASDLELLPNAVPKGATGTSTIVHGTFAWGSNWWRPGGEFHEYLSTELSVGMYSKYGSAFDWNGALLQSRRNLAAKKLKAWSVENTGGAVKKLFSHSYGGEVSSIAIADGLSVDKLILLSAPATDIVQKIAENGQNILDVRVRFDPVLASLRILRRGIGGKQLKNVTKVDVGWGWHSATHDPEVWRVHKIDAQI